MNEIWGNPDQNSLPNVSNIETVPSNPDSTESVEIKASITDDDGTINSAEVSWGLSPTNLNNTISMTDTSGSGDYLTSSSILKQDTGTTVYYQISATDDSSETTTSGILDYTVSTEDNNDGYDGSGKFAKITSDTELEGNFYVIANSGESYAMNNTNTSGYFEHTPISPSNDTILNPDSGIVWEIKDDGSGNKTIYNHQTEKYVALTSDANSAHAIDIQNSDESLWSINWQTDVFIATNKNYTDRDLRYNNTAARFACYSSTHGHNLILYKYVEQNEKYNLTGKVIFKKEINDDILQIDLSSQTSGIYFIKILFGKKIYTKKLMIN